MHEKDLRRLALESGKTMSRKAKARLASGEGSAAGSSRSSAAGSPPNSRNHSPRLSPRRSPLISPHSSRAGSRANSRQGSEDEDEFETASISSTSSLDLGDLQQYDDAAPEIWQQELDECSEQIIERARNMRNTGAAREQMLGIYINILRAQYAADEVSSKLGDLIPALLKIIKISTEEKEILLALKALSITILTTGEEISEQVSGAIKGRIEDPSSEKAQVAAIHALGAASFFGGADQVDTEETMEFLLDIASSDGESVSALDSGPVVTAALQEWGLLATLFDSMNGNSDEAMGAFEDQLDSSILSVQTAAGEDIALIYEKSFVPADESDDDEDEIGEESSDTHGEIGSFRRQNWVHRYQAYPAGQSALESKLHELATMSSRHLGKDNRKNMHQTFRDVEHSVKHPWRGPRYSTATGRAAESEYHLGHRMVLRDGGQFRYTIDRWWKFLRYAAIKRIAGSGAINHFRLNEVVREALPRSLMAPERF